MSPELHQRVRKLFDQALERPENERLAFASTACAGDPEAYQALVRLLEARDPAQSFLEDRPPGIERIGRYLITAELGRGAMGVVYDAVDPLIARKVAVKVIKMEPFMDGSDSEFMRDRLFREARSAGRLLHPGIVVVFDVGQEGDVAFIAMERVDGWSLEKILTSGRRLSVTETFDALRQTADALDYAHRNQIIHRDVKPGNIIFDKSGVVKLTDFGIAKINSTQYQTRTGLVMGTPSYMSPEQIEGKPLDGRSDQFSLVVVAFELLTGSRPFNAETMLGMAHAIVYGARPSASTANPELPPAVDQVLARGLAKLPEERFPTCAEFVGALEKALTGPPAALPVPPPKSKNRTGIFLGLFLMVVIVAGGAYGLITYLSGHASSHPSQPDSQARIQQTLPPVAAAPVVQFTADPSSIKAASSTTLHWDVSGAVRVVIDPAIGVVQASDTARVSPRATTIFKLTATGPGGATTTKQVQVIVDSGTPVASIYAEAVSERRAGHPEKAAALYRQAAGLGEARAMIELGNMSIDAEPKNYPEGMRWFRMAADRGNATGMVLLGGMYYLGRGIAADPAAAAYWFGKASDAGDATGKYDLGMLYESGSGVPRDQNKAIQLYEEASRLGNDEARKRILQLLSSH